MAMSVSVLASESVMRLGGGGGQTEIERGAGLVRVGDGLRRAKRNPGCSSPVQVAAERGGLPGAIGPPASSRRAPGFRRSRAYPVWMRRYASAIRSGRAKGRRARSASEAPRQTDALAFKRMDIFAMDLQMVRTIRFRGSDQGSSRGSRSSTTSRNSTAPYATRTSPVPATATFSTSTLCHWMTTKLASPSRFGAPVET